MEETRVQSERKGKEQGDVTNETRQEDREVTTEETEVTGPEKKKGPKRESGKRPIGVVKDTQVSDGDTT